MGQQGSNQMVCKKIKMFPISNEKGKAIVIYSRYINTSIESWMNIVANNVLCRSIFSLENAWIPFVPNLPQNTSDEANFVSWGRTTDQLNASRISNRTSPEKRQSKNTCTDSLFFWQRQHRDRERLIQGLRLWSLSIVLRQECVTPKWGISLFLDRGIFKHLE